MTAAFMVLSCATASPVRLLGHGPPLAGDPAERIAIDLIGSCKRQFGHENDATRMLVGGRVVERETLDLILSQSCARSEHDKGERLLALDLVRHRHDTGLHDVVVPLEHALDLARIEVLAAAHEHVVCAANERVSASRVTAKDVPRLVPAFL